MQVAASPLEGAITVNIGDILMRWSDDTLKSTYHRVRVPEKVRSFRSAVLMSSSKGNCPSQAFSMTTGGCRYKLTLPGTWRYGLV